MLSLLNNAWQVATALAKLGLSCHQKLMDRASLLRVCTDRKLFQEKDSLGFIAMNVLALLQKFCNCKNFPLTKTSSATFFKVGMPVTQPSP